ncbi:MAG: LysR family transcriptional regulator [Chlorogloeopsis fritschii C42_A2020_084]|uniref:LysR family transcriptional regulator n=1 Tax=Chlorogloeopsis fritschii TaxID=1124 RepID=UPI001A06FF75|nr:LysR family transcriptional regulator [Chlorogloeopsis fritschii]MBF2009042.1 LysR family transcriptional regulator [Chlorogloeopsis fritschii C42_A2020_084]
MELRHLRYFIAVAEELHFSRAAERLHIAQPPLSQQIQQLETELGVELFDRKTKRQVQLTEAGRVFLREAYQLLAQLEEAIELTRSTGRGERGQLRVGFISSVTYDVLPNILEAFHQQFPEVELILQELTTTEQENALRNHRIQVGFAHLPLEDDSLCWECIQQENLFVALPVIHPLAKQEQIVVRSLADEQFILFPRYLGIGLYDKIIALCQQGNFTPKVAQEAIQMQTIIGLVSAGMGIAIVPSSLQNLQRTGVVYRAIAQATPLVETAVVWQPEAETPVMQQFLKVVRSVCNISSSRGE